MKPKLMKTPPQHKILQGESQKLKEKLDSLKKQIQAKKKEKQMSKAGHSQEQKLAHSRKSNISNIETSEELTSLLANLKLQNLASKLKQKKVYTSQQFNSIKVQELESWKDIAVGYRIKIKKHLQNKEGNLSASRKIIPQKTPEKKEESKLNIEDIIKHRKESQKYIPLYHQNQQRQANLQKQLEEQEQEVMIQSLKTAFKFYPNNQLKSDRRDHDADEEIYNSQQQIEQIRYKKPVERIKTVIPSQKWQVLQKLPDYKYCWGCLKMIKNDPISYNARQFCDQICLSKYKQTLQIQDEAVFFESVQVTQQKFEQHMYKRYMKQAEGEGRGVVKQRGVEVEDLDLQIL